MTTAKQILQLLSEANPEIDAMYRKEAEKAYKAILKLLSNRSLRFKYLHPCRETPSGQWSSDSDPLVGYDLYSADLGDDFGLDKDGRNLIISFAKNRSDRGGGFSSPRTITLNIFDQKELESKDVHKIIRKKFADANGKSVFVHEYIHFLDDIRFGLGKSKTYDTDDPQYFNTPAEYNAHFQNGISKFEDMLERTHYFRKMEILNLSRKNLVAQIMFSFRKPFKNFDNKYMKKVLSRVYQYIDSEIPKIKKKELKSLNSAKGFNKLWKEIKSYLIKASKSPIMRDRIIFLLQDTSLKKLEGEVDNISGIRPFLNRSYSKKLDAKLQELVPELVK